MTALVALLLLGAGCVAPAMAPPPSGSGATAVAPTPAVPAAPARPSSPSRKTLYLTFDADMTRGMQARLRSGKVASWYDPGLVAYLRTRRLPAAVFMTGLFAETYPALARSLAADALFRVENHSYDHDSFEPRCYGLPDVLTDAAKIAEVRRAQDDLVRIAGARPRWFRYPGLCHDAHDDAVVATTGLSVNDGDVVSGDAFAKDPAKVAATMLARAHDGGVVVLHLGGPNAPSTLRALEIAVPKLESAGYRFAALPDPATAPRKSRTSASIAPNDRAT